MKYTLDWTKYATLARKAVAEGCVLIKNENHVLPIKNDTKVSVFGRIAFDYYKSGTGSGGMVNAPYVVSIMDALKEESGICINEKLIKVYEDWIEENPFEKGEGWALEPWCQKEMELSEELVASAAAQSDMALVIIGRTAGEDKDNSLSEGSYLLTQGERQMMHRVCSHFDKVAVVLNVGNIIDMNWIEEYNPQSVLYAWQGGMEGGHGTVDVLVGRVNPCGKLSGTIAYDIKDYPSDKNFGNERENLYEEDIYVGYRYFETAAKDRVKYPFGYGLSYTQFDIQSVCLFESDDTVKIISTVKNIGTVAGKEVVQVYYNPPQGRLSKPVRNLIRYEKTKELAPGEEQKLVISFPMTEMKSFDDDNSTGNVNCYVLEKGEYIFYAGNNVRDAKEAGRFVLNDDVVVEQLSEALAPVKPFNRMVIKVDKDNVTIEQQPVSCRSIDMAERIKNSIPNDRECTGDKGYRFEDVVKEKIDLDTYLDQLSDLDLIHMSRGEGMCSSKVTHGIAGSFGGFTKRLQEFGMPIGGCADGPSGMRMDCGTEAFSLPNGTSLACTFNKELVSELYEYAGKEIRYNKIDTILGPGINIHRHPFNGRNFEYFSEDPYLTGSMAVAELNSLHKYNVTGTIKHFAANNQEYKRHEMDSVVSQRALREIYLKPFEMAVREANAYCVMTTYGKLNGIYTGSNFDLCTTILRNEWGFEGMVMTDWWAKLNFENEPESIKNTAAMIIAQNDIYEVTSDAEANANDDNSEEALEKGIITRGQLLRNAKNICKALLKSAVAIRIIEGEDEIEELNRPQSNRPVLNVLPMSYVNEDGNATIDIDGIDTSAGSVNQLPINVPQKGDYVLSIRMKSEAGELSQTTMNVYSNNVLVQSYTINGTKGEWIVKDVPIEVVVSRDVYIDLAFAQSGIEIDSIKMSLKSVLNSKRYS